MFDDSKRHRDPSGSPASGAQSGQWSARISAHYHCQLSTDLVDWFDQEVWRRTSHSEYNEAIDPTILLETSPDVIWPGLMPPDFLPLISNGAGDWLGVRVDEANHGSEIVQWYHGGGDWIPWGRTLAEAILFDAVADRLPGTKRSHAVSAEPPTASPLVDGGFFDWALDHLPNHLRDVCRPGNSGQEIADVMLETGVAETAVRCELIQQSLDESLSSILDVDTVETLGVPWETAVEWMFDLDRIRDAMRTRLANEFDYVADIQQDWDTAQTHAKRVTELSPELAWGWDLLGYGLERQAKTAEAKEAYLKASQLSVFTDQSVRLRTHWSSSIGAKFSIARMNQLCPEVFEAREYLRLMNDEDVDRRRANVSQHWLRLARHSVANQEYATAHQQYVAAGWDLGAEPMPLYGEILQHIADAAGFANQIGRAHVAAAHRECLRQRYNL